MLDAGPEQFAAALQDVERRLNEKIDDLLARRDTLRRMANGDRLLLPDRACALLERMPELGFGEADITGAREALVLVRALVPESLDDYLGQIERSLADPYYVSLIQRWSGAGDWAADDPRVAELATEWADHLIANPSLAPSLPGLQDRSDGADRSELLSHHGEDEKPAWARMTSLIEKRLHAAGIQV
jgi:hypothetical protein